MKKDQTHHHHAHCVTTALAKAAQLCLANGERLTPLRRDVLTELWQSHTARGAYDMLAALNKQRVKKLAPLSVYRVLDFLVGLGLAHRVESLNAYVGCPAPGHGEGLQFLICEQCRTIEELATALPVEKIASQHRFTPRRTIVEISGICKNCLES